MKDNNQTMETTCRAFHLYCADGREQETNTYYKTRAEIKDFHTLLKAAQRDHIAPQMKDNYRNNANFILADCIQLDLDNSHSEDPAEWKTADDISDAFPDVAFLYVHSRNHMKEKTKADRKTGEILARYAPRQKYHCYFPLSRPITDKSDYENLMLKAAALFPFFDLGAAKPAQMFYGVANPTGGSASGDLSIDTYMESVSDDEIIASTKEFTDKVSQGVYSIGGNPKETEKAISRLENILGVALTDKTSDQQSEQTEGNYPEGLDWLETYYQKVSEEWLKRWAGENNVELGRRYKLPANDRNHPKAIAYCVTCPWEENHTADTGEAQTVIIVDQNGKRNFLCRHDHCIGVWRWKDYRAKVEENHRKEQEAQAASNQAGPVADQGQQEEPNREKSCFSVHDAGSYLSNGQYNADIQYFQKYKDRKVGFPTLDKYLTLYPGLCALGGASSLGKTTLAVNIADKLLARGETVLYFSFEQLPIEITTKSLARMLRERNPFTPLTNIDIKNGATCDDLEQVKQEYSELAKNLQIITGNFHTRAADIKEYVERFINEHDGIRPIVIIDYLQLIAPPEGFRGGIREYTDENIKTLKDMQKENELFVLMLSSFNRSSNDVPVSYEAFKETSMVEYTCDYILGLQLAILDAENTEFYASTGSRGGEKVTTIDKRRKMINEAQQKFPKEVELVSLKNRNGRQFFKVFFEYSPQYDLFTEAGDGKEAALAGSGTEGTKSGRYRPAARRR